MMTKTYQEYYELFLEDVKQRENFKPSHLTQLEILCNLYVEMHKLENIVRNKGYTYVSEGRNGVQEKIRPEAQQLNRTRAEIRAYSRMLGLLLVKDSAVGDDDDEEKAFS